MDVPTYIISLKNSDDLLKYLVSHNLNAELVNGVDGYKLSNKEIKNNTTYFYSYFGPISTIGCAMAHIKVWKKFLDSNKNYCIIFEDDVVLENNFVEDFEKAINNVPKDFDILYLGCFGCDNNTNLFTIPFSLTMNLKDTEYVNQYIKKPKIAFALHAYTLSRKGAEKLLYFIEGQISYHIDVMIMDLYSKNKINAYSLVNRIAYQTSSDTCNSLNTANHPYIINRALSFIHIDKMVRMNYYTSCSIAKIGNFNINVITIVFFILGVILSINKIDIKTLTIIYLFLSLPDMFIYKYINSIIFHYFIFILPSFIRIYNLKKN
jgi:glycosyl transferase family 25